jgi:hypothetical protein
MTNTGNAARSLTLSVTISAPTGCFPPVDDSATFSARQILVFLAASLAVFGGIAGGILGLLAVCGFWA